MDGVPAHFLVLAEGDDADELGTTIATITKTWVPGATTTFTSPDNYTVRVRRQLTDPLASLVLAAAIVIDTVCPGRPGRPLRAT